MLLMEASGSTPRYGPITRSRYAFAAASGSMFRANSPPAPGIAVGAPDSRTPRTSSRFDAGSVLTSSTFLPFWAMDTAAAQASDVLPTPPFPVKKRMRVAFSRKLIIFSIVLLSLASSTAG